MIDDDMMEFRDEDEDEKEERRIEVDIRTDNCQ